MTFQNCPVCGVNKAKKEHKTVAAAHSAIAKTMAARGELINEKPKKIDYRAIPAPSWYFTKSGHRREM